MDSDSTIDVGDYSNSTHITYTKKSRRVRGAASPKVSHSGIAHTVLERWAREDLDSNPGHNGLLL